MKTLLAAALVAAALVEPAVAASFVGTVKLVPRDGHVVVAVDEVESGDGIVDVVVVAEVDQSVQEFRGHALVELTDAGLRVVATEPKLRIVATLTKPRAVQTQRGKLVAVSMDEVESLNLEPATVAGRRLMNALFDSFGPDPDIERLRDRFITADEGGDGPRDCVGTGDTERCEEPPVEEPGGGGGGPSPSPSPSNKCSKKCTEGECSVTCLTGFPFCRCSNDGRHPLCACM